ncbi:MAG: aldehyde-activating protein [Alphaproteobacteria bacterium]|nr:aldehyde-activating protein [Alphaproteobacteria bacterium]
MNAKHSGSCLCGTVKFSVSGDFDAFFLCHCSRCRKDTGSAHGANLFSGTARIDWIAGHDRISLFQVPHSQHVRSFCSVCGSALPSMQMDGALLVVPAGSLDSAIAMRPDAHIFAGSRAAWDWNLAEIPAFEALPVAGPKGDDQ